MHRHVLAGTICFDHRQDELSARCLRCGLLVIWAGPPELYRVALYDTLDQIASHCGSHNVETSVAEIRALVICNRDT